MVVVAELKADMSQIKVNFFNKEQTQKTAEKDYVRAP